MNIVEILARFAPRPFSGSRDELSNGLRKFRTWHAITGTGPWTCPTCGSVAHALAMIGDRWLCAVDFQALRAKGEDPVIRDAVISASAL
jgi:hypothetical protein